MAAGRADRDALQSTQHPTGDQLNGDEASSRGARTSLRAASKSNKRVSGSAAQNVARKGRTGDETNLNECADRAGDRWQHGIGRSPRTIIVVTQRQLYRYKILYQWPRFSPLALSPSLSCAHLRRRRERSRARTVCCLLRAHCVVNVLSFIDS